MTTTRKKAKKDKKDKKDKKAKRPIADVIEYQIKGKLVDGRSPDDAVFAMSATKEGDLRLVFAVDDARTPFVSITVDRELAGFLAGGILSFDEALKAHEVAQAA